MCIPAAFSGSRCPPESTSPLLWSAIACRCRPSLPHNSITAHNANLLQHAQLLLEYGTLVSAPRPLGLDAPAEHFSEARALQHVTQLTANGVGRLVSHPGIEHGIKYLTQATADIAAAAGGRHDIHVQVGALL